MITAAGPCESDMIPGPFNLLTAAVHGSAPPAAGGAAEATVTVTASLSGFKFTPAGGTVTVMAVTVTPTDSDSGRRGNLTVTSR